jgi:hypothetical protein
LSIPYKILSNIILLRMTLYAGAITGDYQCGFRGNILTIDHIFSIRKILGKKQGYNKDYVGYL